MNASILLALLAATLHTVVSTDGPAHRRNAAGLPLPRPGPVAASGAPVRSADVFFRRTAYQGELNDVRDAVSALRKTEY